MQHATFSNSVMSSVIRFWKAFTQKPKRALEVCDQVPSINTINLHFISRKTTKWSFPNLPQISHKNQSQRTYLTKENYNSRLNCSILFNSWFGDLFMLILWRTNRLWFEYIDPRHKPKSKMLSNFRQSNIQFPAYKRQVRPRDKDHYRERDHRNFEVYRGSFGLWVFCASNLLEKKNGDFDERKEYLVAVELLTNEVLQKSLLSNKQVAVNKNFPPPPSNKKTWYEYLPSDRWINWTVPSLIKSFQSPPSPQLQD